MLLVIVWQNLYERERERVIASKKSQSELEQAFRVIELPAHGQTALSITHRDPRKGVANT